MKRNASIFLCIALVAAIPALAQNTPAAPAGASVGTPAVAATGKIGIISIQQAIVQSNEGQRDFQALAKKVEPKQTELQKMNTEVEDLKKQLQTQGDKLNDDARGNLARSIDQKSKTLQRDYDDYQSDLQSQQNDIANRIGGKMMQVLDKYAKDNGYSVILDVSSPQSPVLWASNATDITKAIVDAYNASSGVPAPAPAAKPAAAATRPGAPTAPSATRPAPTTTRPKPPGE